MIALATSFCFTACGDDDDEPSYPTPNPVEESKLTFDKDTVLVGVHENTTFNITDGGGDYKMIVEDTTVAQAMMNGNAITVSSQKKGITGIVISDAKGGYKRVIVKSMYFSMKLNKDKAYVGMKLGHTDGTTNVSVLEGNGNYKAVSADESIAKVSRIIGDSIVVIHGVGTGSTVITVTDMMGLKQTVDVTVEVTSVPYTDEEKEELKNDNESHWTWDGNRTSNQGWSSYNYTHGTADNGRTTVYFEYASQWWNQKYSQVWFTGDLSVGKKTNGRIFYDNSWNGYDYNENVEVEIIKNDGKKVWGIFSVIKDDYLHYGNFVIDL